MVRVGALGVGATFTTALTNRAGHVVGTGKSHRTHHCENGMAVYLEAPDEEKYIHRDVFVVVERIH